jgi:type II restriction/modification system DNA methylase subunit YeeA
MDTAYLKRFAQQARRSLQDQVSSKLKFVLAPESAARREHPIAVQKLEEAIKNHGKPVVVDQVAYTWFNRFCALRFMDANRYNSTNIVSPAEVGQYQPEILAEAKLGHIDTKLVDEKVQLKVNRLLSGADPSRDPQAEAYRLLIVAACNYWNGAMPFLFQRIDDFTELLLPDDLLSENSILTQTREALTEDACQDVEVIGWLYQFYISEKKDEVMARKSAVPTEDIPAVTQLFTPHWIVRYLVENSLGRLWMLNRPASHLVQQMEYYIKPEEPETDYLRIDSVEDIKVCDPACGSGHMLTYAFDLLYAMYEEEGYAAPEIPKLILSKNLVGIEIDDRAGELAAFALTMKARAKDRRIFSRNVNPQITVLEDIQIDEAELADYKRHINDNRLFTADVQNLLTQFENAKTFGSLIQPVLSEQKIIGLRDALLAKEPAGDLYLLDTHNKVMRVLEQGEALTQRYHVVVANPPYMGSKGMNTVLGAWGKSNYPDSKSDSFAMFIERGLNLTPCQGYCALVTMESWMFLSSYEQLRIKLLDIHILSLLHMPYVGKGGTSMGINFGTAATIFHNVAKSNAKGHYSCLRYWESDENGVPFDFPIRNERLGFLNNDQFSRIPGCPIAYWMLPADVQAFSVGKLLKDVFDPRQGMATGQNSRFVREWFEVDWNKVGVGFTSRDSIRSSAKKWFPYNKGGAFRKWYGNREHVIAFDNENYKILKNQGNHCPSEMMYFQDNVGWAKVGSGDASFRYYDGFIFDVAGCSIFGGQFNNKLRLLGYLNSVVIKRFLAYLSPTMNFEVGTIKSLPLCEYFSIKNVTHDEVLHRLLDIAKLDWNSFETSWDFTLHPILNREVCQTSLVVAYEMLSNARQQLVQEMHLLEEENNRIYINAYGLKEEVVAEVSLSEITLNINAHFRYGTNKSKEDRESLLLADTMRDFISYAVGCMFGRYALEEPGLTLANQGETLEDYLKRIPEPSFPADEDNVIPVLDGEWFTDDIVERFKQFLRITFGEASYPENLRFIEAALGTESKPKSLRDYFVKDFYNDHIKRYKKRPIYWMFTSPKGSFNALIYMHRYRPDTVSLVLNNYLREFRTKLIAHKAHLEAVSISAGSSQADKTKALKEIEKVSKAIVELEDYERDVLYPLATEKLAIDLDDGVKVNYLKFGSALKKIPGLEAKED